MPFTISVGATSLVIGAALQVDYVITGSVQSFTRKDTGIIEIILSGQMYEVASNINPATGEPCAEPKVFRAFGVSGASCSRASQACYEGPMVGEAVRDAAAKAAAVLSGCTPVVDISSGRKSVSSGYKWVLFALLLGAVALAVNNGNGNASGGSTGAALPPTDLRTEESQGAIILTWRAPTGTTLTLLRYQIERSVDGSAFQRIGSGAVGASATSFNDFNTLVGRHTYQYRIRAVYTSNQVSPYAISGAIIVTR